MTMKDDFALIIGINHYPSFTSLNGPINDANAFHNWLHDVAGMPESQIFKVISVEQEPPVPVQDQIDRALEKIYEEVIKDNKTGRKFFFYFSGHGLGTDIEDTALCLAGWSRLMKNNALSSEKYLKMILSSNIFSEIYFFMDCCRNRLTGHRGKHPGIEYPVLSAGNQPLKYVAYATEYMDSAYEDLIEEGSELSKYRGHFTRALIDGFREAVNSQGELTTGKLHDYLMLRTREIARSASREQKAIVETTMASDTVIFRYQTVDNTRNCKISFDVPDSRKMVLEDSELNIVREDVAGTETWDLILPYGLYSIREESNTIGNSFPVRPGEGALNVNI